MQKDSQHEAQSEPTLTDDNFPVQPTTPTSQVVIAEPLDPAAEAPSPQPAATLLLTDQSSLEECVAPYRQELMLRGKSTYTITCFLSDLKMLREHCGNDTPVGRLTKEHVTDWLMNLKFGKQGQTPAPKTMARRVTFLKNFFSWLANERVISEDPSSSLTLERPLPPLPQLLLPAEIQKLLDAAAEDARCQCLIYLVLFAGLKKEEVMGLKMEDVDLSTEQTPMITIHFAPAAGKQHRERRLVLPAEFNAMFQRYVERYHPTETVFVCTDRNLNYILAKAVKAADIKKRVTLQLLRDTFAVQQLQNGTTPESVREKLGLSEEAWLESREKYRRLAFPVA
jgi:integrase/recombinase XerD